MLGQIQGEVRFKESLSYHTSLRIGGPADIFIAPQTGADVRHALGFAERDRLPVVVIGGGNSILVKGHGIRGVVLKLASCLSRAQFHGEEVVAGSGTPVSALIREAAALDLGGLECLAGIPGTVGGALVTNAGAADGRIGDLVTAVSFLHPDGSLGELNRNPSASRGWTYDLPFGAVVLGCRVRLRRRPLARIQRDLQHRLRVKRTSQPLALASAGWIWKSPPGESASHLIEKVGLRGRRLGGAEISEKDTNFIVNRGSATVTDVLDLMQLTRDRVQKKFDVTLSPAIRILGDQ